MGLSSGERRRSPEPVGMRIRRCAQVAAMFLLTAGTALAQNVLFKEPPTVSQPAPPPRPIAAVYELKGDPPEFKKLFDLPDNHRCNSPRVTADGRRLAFDGWNKVGGESNSEAKVFFCNLDGTDMKSVCVGAMPSPAPDGKRFACSRYNAHRGVWIMDVDGGEQLIDREGWGIQWSPDGASVAYTRGNNIVVRTVATGDERFLFRGNGSPYESLAWNMSWSADSKKLAFLGWLNGGSYDLVTVDIQGAELGFNRRASGNFVPSITWNADRKPLVLPDKVGKTYRMLELDPAGKEEPRLIPGIPADSKATSATWSPDGSRLIVICNFN